MNTRIVNESATDAAVTAETRLRGEALEGPEQRRNIEHAKYEKSRDPGVELRLDGEDDTLYADGLDIGDNSLTLAGTDGDRPKGIKG